MPKLVAPANPSQHNAPISAPSTTVAGEKLPITSAMIHAVTSPLEHEHVVQRHVAGVRLELLLRLADQRDPALRELRRASTTARPGEDHDAAHEDSDVVHDGEGHGALLKGCRRHRAVWAR